MLSRTHRTTIAALLAACASVGQADVVMRPLPVMEGRPVSTTRYISIEGTIGPADPLKLLEYLPQWRGAIGLNSPGGDVRASLQLGRLLRQEGRAAIVGPDHHCASACVFVLAGAPMKIVYGRVAIHRPYVPNDVLTNAADQKARYGELSKEVKPFLEEMNVLPTLYDDMIRISPGTVRVLTKPELERYGLTGVDPFVDEAGLTQSADFLRISKQELLRRRALIARDCVNLSADAYGECAVATEYGISKDEYRRRDREAQAKCAGESDRGAWVQCHLHVTRGF
jgi:hypothetical protein